MVSAAIRANVRIQTIVFPVQVSPDQRLGYTACLVSGMLIRLCYADHEELSNECNSRYLPREHNHQSPEGKMKRPTSTPDTEPQITREARPLTEQIRQRAYELYELRGQGDGHELDDWLLAESELIQKREATDSQELS